MNRRSMTRLCSVAIGMAMAAHAAAEDGARGAPAPAAGKRITLQTAGTDIGNALRLVAEQGGLNLVIGPDVKGDVSVYMDDVAVETALKAIAVNNGFAFTVEDGVITVSKPPEPANGATEVIPPVETRIFTLQWQDARRVKDALEFALSRYGKIKVLNENSRNGYGVQRLNSLGGELDTGSGSSSGNASDTQGGSTAVGPGGTSAGADLARNARTLVVTDVEENLKRIADLIADLDKLPPQVLIEARIVEMSLDLQRQLGIDWNVDVLASGPVLNHEWPIRNRAGFAAGTDRLPFGPQIRFTPNGTPLTATGLSLGTIDFTRFTALLRAHQADNAIRMLANPRMLVHNNHSASILVGERYPILRSTVTDFGTVTESFDTYIPVGIQLEVTPTIMADGRISMMVHPATSSLGDDVVGTTGLRVARIRTREMDTRVITRDGQTVVLGGLISDRKTRVVSKVPGLGDWPVLSLFFRQESPRSERVDLLIFLTAHIEAAARLTERDREIFEMYRPHFKHIDYLQDVPLHFEIPTEYESPKPMFGDPPFDEYDEEDEETYEETAAANPKVPLKQAEDGPAAAGSGAAAIGNASPARAPTPPATRHPPHVEVGAKPGSRPARRLGPRFKPAQRDKYTEQRMMRRRARQMAAVSEAKTEERP